MIYLLDTSRKQFDAAPSELGVPQNEVGQLITPAPGYIDYGAAYGIDNGGYSKADPKRWRAIMKRQYESRDRCKFITLPDVVGNARRTLELFDQFYIETRSWPRALVIQNGQEDLAIPWSQLSAIFIGGDDKFKTSQASADIIRSAKWLGKWVHVGRVNTVLRREWCEENEVDSIDGTGIAKYTHMRKSITDNHMFSKVSER